MKRALLFFALIWSSLTVFLAIAYAASLWPLKEPIDLSSGFGDFRNGRFHAGIDLRTGGVPGKQLFSPVNGYLYKIRMSYYGYGKGLYLKGDDGYIYVFGHLSGFAPDIERVVQARQLAAQRYYVDIDFPADSARVKAGQLLGYTGQTGVGAPHLHFEKRTADNLPLNPLTHGYPVSDNVKPFFTRIAFQLTDDRSLFANSQRKIFLDIPASDNGHYRLDTVLYFNAPIGVLADCFDRMRPGGMRQAVYKLTLYVDNVAYYQVTLDTIDYETTQAADLVYDYEEAADGEPRVRRLYHRLGNDYAGSEVHGEHFGFIGADSSFAVGHHTGRIVAEDAFGNQSDLTFRFLWGPPGNLFVSDSAVVASDSNTVFYFTAKAGIEQLGIDTIVVALNRGMGWATIPSISVQHLNKRRLKATVYGNSISALTLRMVALTSDSCAILDFPFNGLEKKSLKPLEVHHEVTDDGLIIWAQSIARTSFPVQAELYFQDSLLGIEHLAQFFSMSTYVFFVPPRPVYSHIDKIIVRSTDNPSAGENVEDNLFIARVGDRDSLELRVDSYFSVRVNGNDVYEPRFIELKKNELASRSLLSLNSDHYEILPESVLLKGNVGITLEADAAGSYLDKTALYRLNKEANRWEWVTQVRDPRGAFTGQSRHGGSYALVWDLDPPAISDLNIEAQPIVRESQPTFTLRLQDELSGIEDDRSIVIKVDGRWQIPEYDPESGVCRVKSSEPLTLGDHNFEIEVTDRVGNRATQSQAFRVVQAARRAKGL